MSEEADIRKAENEEAVEVLKQIRINCGYQNVQPPVISNCATSDQAQSIPIQMYHFMDEGICQSNNFEKDEGEEGVLVSPMSFIRKLCARGKTRGTHLDWTAPLKIGHGICSVTGILILKPGIPPYKGYGEGRGKDEAEEAAAISILKEMIIDCALDVDEKENGSEFSHPGVPDTTTGQAGTLRNAFVSDTPRSKTYEPESDLKIVESLNAPDKNYVKTLKAYCAKKGIAQPRYMEVRPTKQEKPTKIMTFCTAGGKTEFGEAEKRATSKKIAAFKVIGKLTSEVDWVRLNKRSSVTENSMDSLTPRQSINTSEDMHYISQEDPNVKVPGSKDKSNEQDKQDSDKEARYLETALQKDITTPLQFPPSSHMPAETIHISQRVSYYPSISLGKGAFAEVFLGYLENPTRKMAVKMAKKEDIDDPKCKELEILGSLDDENLVKYYITEEMHDHYYIVMDLADHNLDTWVTTFYPTKFETLVKICRDIAIGVDKLHSQKIIHRDIKPHNVLIFLKKDTDGYFPLAKLSDFGISRIMDRRPDGVTTQLGNKGTMTYIPPEGFTHPINTKFDLQPSFDVFSLGIVFAFVMTGGKHIFASTQNVNPMIIQMNIVSAGVNWKLLSKPELIPLRNLLQVMLAQDPKDRSNMEILMEHPFFWTYQKSFDFILAVSNDMKNQKVEPNKIKKAYEEFRNTFPGTPKDWKMRLNTEIQDWICAKNESMKKPGKVGPFSWKPPDGNSIEKLINFTRDQYQHYKGWLPMEELRKPELFGADGYDYGPYFAKTFPELATLLYNVLQHPAKKGIHTGRFYIRNDIRTFELVWNGRN